MQQREADEAHQPTVEEVVDQEDVEHPPPSQAHAPAAEEQEAPVPNGTTMSAKAQGKQREQPAPVPAQSGTPSAATARLDTQSEEAFPSLGPSKAKAPASTAWGSRPSFANRPQGPNGAATSGGASTQGATPSRGTAQQISLPGRYQEDMRMRTDQLRQDLRRPLADTLKDINKKSKAKVEMARANGFVTFRGSGPNQESVHQVLKEVAVQLGERVSIQRHSLVLGLTRGSKPSKYQFQPPFALTSSGRAVLLLRA